MQIFGSLGDSAEISAYRRALDANEGDLSKVIAAVYANEVKRMEMDGWADGLGPVVWQNMRFARITEKLALVWRHFLRILEQKWQELTTVKVARKNHDGNNELSLQLELFNWCIERELEWHRSVEEAGFRVSELLPPLPHFSSSNSASMARSVDLNEALAEQSLSIEAKLQEVKKVIEDLDNVHGASGDAQEAVTDEDEECNVDVNSSAEISKTLTAATGRYAATTAATTTTTTAVPTTTTTTTTVPTTSTSSTSSTSTHSASDLQRIGKLKHNFNFESDIWIPLTLNCQPPPPNLPLPPSAPLAGDIVALAQLKSDMAAFKAANPDLLQPGRDWDAFTAFLLWHSPNDVETDPDTAKPVVSSRMLDPAGQWQELWRESEPRPLSPATFRAHVSFNHRSLAGQLLADWSTQWDAQMLLEALVPDIIRSMADRQSELLQLLSRDTGNVNRTGIVTGIDSATDSASATATTTATASATTTTKDLAELCAQTPFPLDRLTEALDEQERLIADTVAVRQLGLRSEAQWLLVDEADRQRLLDVGRFELVRREVVGAGWYWCEDRREGRTIHAKRETFLL